jgi:Excalibur calcium-binding domain
VAFERSSRARLLPLAVAPVLFSLLALTEAGAVTPVPGCASFRSQAEAQQYFADYGGGPKQRVGDLDPDRDGVACEDSPAPYTGYATIGYNRKRAFFYGTVTMPSATAAPAPGEKSACLYGNRHFPEGPRLLRIYRVTAKGPIPVTDAFGAEARPQSSRLLWKEERRKILPSRYYAAFDERVPISPYGANECPGFSSAEVRLPPPLKR